MIFHYWHYWKSDCDLLDFVLFANWCKFNWWILCDGRNWLISLFLCVEYCKCLFKCFAKAANQEKEIFQVSDIYCIDELFDSPSLYHDRYYCVCNIMGIRNCNLYCCLVLYSVLIWCFCGSFERCVKNLLRALDGA